MRNGVTFIKPNLLFRPLVSVNAVVLVVEFAVYKMSTSQN